MKQKIEVHCYIVNDIKNEDSIREYFKGKYWIQISEFIYRRKYLSLYFEFKRIDNELHIITWTKGSMGLILPHKRQFIGLIGKPDLNTLQKEFQAFLTDNSIKYFESLSEKTGMRQSTYLAIIYSTALLLAIVLYIILT